MNSFYFVCKNDHEHAPYETEICFYHTRVFSQYDTEQLLLANSCRDTLVIVYIFHIIQASPIQHVDHRRS